MKRMLALIATVGLSKLVFADYRGEVNIEYLTGSAETASGYVVPDYTPPVGPVDPPTTGTPPALPPISPEPGTYSDDDYDGWAISGTYYLQPVDTSLGPLRLAPFLSKASSIGGKYGEIETDRSDIETKFWEVETRLVINQAWVLEAGFGAAEIDTVIATNDVDIYRVAAGYYVADTTQLRVAYDVMDEDTVDADRWSIDIQHVQQLENGMTWSANVLYGLVAGDTRIGRDDDGSDIEIALSWFFSHNLGVGANLDIRDRDVTGDVDYYQYWASYFPTDKISLELSYYDEDNNDLNVSSDGFVFEAKYRF
jgi:hypothetical protein